MLLSIITINFNNLEGLKKTMTSVLGQTWTAFEYIVIDGGSTDGSAAYIESQSNHIDYWVSEPDKGIYNAMNKGIKVAKGEYLLFLNSGDDLVDFEALGKTHIHLKEKELIYFDINVKGENIFFIKKCPSLMTFSFLYLDTIPHQATFIRKSLFEKIGYYDENLKIISDWKFFIIAFSKYNASYEYIEAVFSNYYMDGISSDVDNHLLLYEEREKVIKEYFPQYLRLLVLERFLKDIKKSRTIIFIRKLGLLKFIDKIN